MKKISYLLFLFLLLSQVAVAVADVDTEPEKKLKTSVNKLFTVLSDKELSLDQKKNKVVEISNSVFSFSLMAKLSLGKAHWSELNAKQRTAFVSLFTELFQNSYVDKLDSFSDEKVIFQPATVIQKKKARIQTVLISKGKKYSILYKMFRTENDWKIYDFEIEGVSMLQSYRSQYHLVLKRDKIEGLLTKMREQKRNNTL